jgi:hypothetical protein
MNFPVGYWVAQFPPNPVRQVLLSISSYRLKNWPVGRLSHLVKTIRIWQHWFKSKSASYRVRFSPIRVSFAQD